MFYILIDAGNAELIIFFKGRGTIVVAPPYGGATQVFYYIL